MAKSNTTSAKAISKARPVARPAARKAAPVASQPVAAAPAPEADLAVTEIAATQAAPEITTSIPAKTPVLQLKDITMTTDFTATITEAATEAQAKFKEAFDKGTGLVAEMTELAKGNVEAVVESGKLFAAGAQDMGKAMADEAKTVYETATADLKEIAAIKSPTELFQLQGKLLRRNFDMFVAATSKNTDAAIKLANDAFAPISGRVNVAAETLAKVA